MRRLRVLLLMHHDLVPPESIEGLSDAAHFPQITHGGRIVELIRGEA